MARRPTGIDIPPAPSPSAFETMSRPLFTPQGCLGTPHSDVPPALSPLDAFAMQSRMLAKKFEEQSLAGRRMSRLPHQTIQSEFGQPRPGYFRSLTSESLRPPSPVREEEQVQQTARNVSELHQGPRPMSHYPQMITTDSFIGGAGRNPWFQNNLDQVEEYEDENIEEDTGSFRFPRAQSPEQYDPRYDATPLAVSMAQSIGSSNSAESLAQSAISPKYTFGHSHLAPPGQHPRTYSDSASSRSATNDMTDDFSQFNLEADSHHGLDRPTLPHQNSFQRSPSLASDRSFASNLARPSFNFSRPISRQSRPSGDYNRSLESPYRQNSGAKSGARTPLDAVYRQDSTETPLTPFTNDAPHTPTSLMSDELFLSQDPPGESTPQSFVYTKYSIGPKTQRESVALEDFISRQFATNWDNPKSSSQLSLPFQQPRLPHALQSPPSPALTGSPPASRRRKPPRDIFTGRDSPRPSFERTVRNKLQKSRPSTPVTTITTSDASTVKPERSSRSPPSSKEQSAEEHLQRGIDLHEAGKLQESTYHLRLAAKANHPTAMLLYALACRHGWGMKQNAADAVYWLQNAINSTQLEVAEDEVMLRDGRNFDPSESRSHKAQFALSVYELGMSYMNGWGIGQDKPLGLKCFEIAGKWGDSDALAEAAQCYKDGVGCKKDTRKAAHLYRQAEAKGVIVAGNSWIHKEKYRDAPTDSNERGRPSRKASTDSGKKRDKSRTRTFFNRRKTVTENARPQNMF